MDLTTYIATKASISSENDSSDLNPLENCENSNIPANWDRPLPYFPTADDFEGWEPKQRKELCSPLFASAHSLVMLIDYWLHTLNSMQFCRLFWCSISVVLSCSILNFIKPHLLLSLGSLLSLWCVSVCIARVAESSIASAQFRPFWAFISLLFAIGLLSCAVFMSSLEAATPLLYVFMIIFIWAFPYVVLVAIRSDAQYATYKIIMKRFSVWIRTPIGLIGVLLYEIVCISLYVFSLTAFIPVLSFYSLAFVQMGMFMVPVQTIWCLCFHLPLSWLLLISSLQLNELSESSLLSIAEMFLFGPLLEYARILLDLHYASAVSGAICLFIGTSNVITVFWSYYHYLSWETLRVTLGFMHTIVLYFSSILLLALAKKEDHSILYFIYSVGASVLFVICLQPFAPYMVNFSSAENIAREALPLSQMGGFVTGDVEIEDLQGIGLGVVKKQANAAMRRKFKNKVGTGSPVAVAQVNTGLIGRNERQLGGWQLVLLLMSLRMTYLADENKITYMVACAYVAYSVILCLKTHGSILLALVLDTALLHIASNVESLAIAVIALVAHTIHWFMGITALRIRPRYWPLCGLIGLLLGSIISPNVSDIGDSDPTDPWEEVLAENFLKWSCQLFELSYKN